MEKITLELAKYPEHPEGYGLMYPPSDRMVWDFILENMPKDKKYLKYLVRTKWIYNGAYEEYVVGFNQRKIPQGDLIYYIDIYIEDK